MLSSSISLGSDIIRISGEVVPIIEDEDNDGVNDNDDICPDTPMGFIVDSSGCSSRQFCLSYPIIYKWINNKLIINGNSSKLCLKADWLSNEPKVKFPNDCYVVKLVKEVYCRDTPMVN